MLRITPLAGPEPVPTWKLEGKLVGPWVAALREACAPDGRSGWTCPLWTLLTRPASSSCRNCAPKGLCSPGVRD